jgi:hypothetical protein
MTLTEFLLARIAEGEEVALSAIRQRDDEITRGVYVAGLEPQPDADQPVVWDDWMGGPGIRMGAERLRAECEAKRRIVEAFEEERVRRDIYNRGYDDGDLTTKDDFRARTESNARCRGLEIAMQALALPYADHPEYREEWKP